MADPGDDSSDFSADDEPEPSNNTKPKKPKKKPKKSQIKKPSQSIDLFFHSVGIPGLLEIRTSDTIFLKIFWSLVLIVVWSIFLHKLYFSIRGYLSGDTSIQQQFVLGGRPPVPTLTVCVPHMLDVRQLTIPDRVLRRVRPQNEALIKQSLVSALIDRYTDSSQKPIDLDSLQPFFNTWTFASMRQISKFLNLADRGDWATVIGGPRIPLRPLADVDIWVRDILRATLVNTTNVNSLFKPCSMFLRSCSMDEMEFDCCASTVGFALREYGQCYQFNESSFRRELDGPYVRSRTKTFKIIVQYPMSEVTYEDGVAPSGVNVHVTDSPSTVPTDITPIPSDSDAILELSIPSWYREYTNCRLPATEGQRSSDLSPCDRWIYGVDTVSHAQWTPDEDNVTDRLENRYARTRVTVNLQATSYFAYTEVSSNAVYGIISDIGCLVCLWAGASLTSFIEVVFYAGVIVWVYAKAGRGGNGSKVTPAGVVIESASVGKTAQEVVREGTDAAGRDQVQAVQNAAQHSITVHGSESAQSASVKKHVRQTPLAKGAAKETTDNIDKTHLTETPEVQTEDIPGFISQADRQETPTDGVFGTSSYKHTQQTTEREHSLMPYTGQMQAGIHDAYHHSPHVDQSHREGLHLQTSPIHQKVLHDAPGSHGKDLHKSAISDAHTQLMHSLHKTHNSHVTHHSMHNVGLHAEADSDETPGINVPAGKESDGAIGHPHGDSHIPILKRNSHQAAVGEQRLTKDGRKVLIF